MLANAAIVEAVAEAVAEAGDRRTSSSIRCSSRSTAHPLLGGGRGRRAPHAILPLATLVDPEPAEAAGLTGIEVGTRDDMRRAADAILAPGAGAVLVKGGHLEGRRARRDLFVDARRRGLARRQTDRHAAHARDRVHAVARRSRRISRGATTLRDAVAAGKAFVTEAIRHALADRQAGSGRSTSSGRSPSPERRSGVRDARDLAGLDAARAGVHALRACRRRARERAGCSGPTGGCSACARTSPTCRTTASSHRCRRSLP